METRSIQSHPLAYSRKIFTRENTTRPAPSTQLVFICITMSTKKTRSTSRFTEKSTKPSTDSMSVSMNPNSKGVTIATKTSETAVTRSHDRRNAASRSITPPAEKNAPQV